MTEAVTLPLSVEEQVKLQTLDIGYRFYLSAKEDQLILEVYSQGECVFEDSYYCLSFAGYHDFDTWDSACASAAQDLRESLTKAEQRG